MRGHLSATPEQASRELTLARDVMSTSTQFHNKKKKIVQDSNSPSIRVWRVCVYD